MKKMIKKILIISIFLILTYINGIKTVYAGIDISAYLEYGDLEDLFDSDGDGIPGGGIACDGGVHAYCKISRGTEVWSKVYGEAYDMYGNYVGDVFEFKNPQPFLAGTHIGLNIYEDKGYESWATYNVSALKITYLCTKRVETDICIDYKYCGTPTSGGVYKCGCKEYWKYDDTYTTYVEGGCKEGYKVSAYWERATPCSSAVEECSARATPAKIDIGGPSYKITYKDSNDINTTEKNDDDIYNTMEEIVAKSCTDNDIEKSDGKNTRKNSCKYTYNREKACMNVKNGEVRYINKEETCAETLPSKECDAINGCNIEYEITYNDKYWKYFIPLNATSKNNFSLLMAANGDELQYGILCKEIIDKYDNYADLIVTANEEKLPAVTSDMHPVIKENIKKDAKEMVKNGCKYTSTINIPIIQRFYNELDNGINIKGFNFYYKPIDINNPFPNGLTDSSLWYDWNEDRTKGPDISESYDEVTYYASTSGNEESIRKYNNQRTMDDKKKDYPYTSWKGKNNEDINGGMNVNGTSNFIKNQGIVTRNIRTDSFYPLGCGPLNEFQYNEDGSRNYFYQPECDRS